MILYLSAICSSYICFYMNHYLTVLFLPALNHSSKMENIFSNVTLNSSKPESYTLQPFLFLSLIDIFTVLVGQPVIAALLWITFTSKKNIDILNCNLALFHNLQYFMLVFHLFVLFLLPHAQANLLKFVFVYAQIGGPMNLSFVCMERYVAVIHPTSYPLLKKYRWREVCVVTVWLFSVHSAFGNVFAENSSYIIDTSMQVIPISLMVFMTVLMVRFSVSVARALKRFGPGRNKMHPIKKRAFKTVCATSTIVLFCYIPVTFLQKLKFVNENAYYCVVMPCCILLLSFASVVHPLFYLSTQGKLFTCLK